MQLHNPEKIIRENDRYRAALEEIRAMEPGEVDSPYEHMTSMDCSTCLKMIEIATKTLEGVKTDA